MPKIAGERRRYLNQPAADGTFEHICHCANHRVQVGRFGVQMLLSGEDQKLFGKLSATCCRTRSRLHQLPSPLVSAEPGFKKFEVAKHPGKEIDEIVREAAGKLANRFHFL